MCDSQTGEDGVIEKILEVIPEHDKWCVEFGAWDGVFLTNTRNLIESQGYSAGLIEADKAHFHALQQNYAQHANVITMNRRVGFGQADGLDNILSTTPVPREFDFLSIDIDGNDYHVWRAISHYRPKVVLIEFNPTIPTPVRFVQPADPSVSQGASLLSLVELGKEKGYELVAVLQWNAFFVRSELTIRCSRSGRMRQKSCAPIWMLLRTSSRAMTAGCSCAGVAGCPGTSSR